MQDNFLGRNSNLSQSENDHLSDFKYILANQHSKQFHLIDSPDLIFQLSQYKFHQPKYPKPNPHNQPHSSLNKKLYRHKSQQETIQNDIFNKNLHFNNQNPNLSSQKFKPTRISFNDNSPQPNLINPGKKIQFNTKQKSYTNKDKLKQSSLKIDFKNLLEKQNIHAKILSVSRPLTSSITNIKNQPSKQHETKSSWKKVFQRKKYSDLKGKLQNLIKNVQNCENFNFSEVFEYQQAILKEYLESLVSELKKQCVQKGQLIEMIWNTFFTLINKIMKMLIQKKKFSQKNQLQTEINLHEGYQDMYVYEANKIIQLGKKYNESKNVIDRLVYELRYKRKQTKKLCKSLAICNEKLNEYKVEHIDLQNEHIDLLIEAKQMGKNQASQILKRKLQVNKQKYIKLRVGMNKEKMKEKIENQIQAELLDPEEQKTFKRQLFEKINSFKLKKKKSPTQQKQQNHFVQDFIERYSNKFIQSQQNSKEVEITKTIRRPQKNSIGINTQISPKGRNQITYSVTQTTFSDKLEFALINHHSTQTPGIQKIKKCENVQVQADGDLMKIFLTKARMMTYRTMNLSFYFDVKKRDEKIKHVLSNRKSQLSVKKQYKQNDSISQISSDESDSVPVVKSKKRLSKNQVNQKRDKKLSIFNSTLPNYANLKTTNSQPQNGKNEPKSKIQNKRASQMPQNFQMSFQQSEYKRQQSRSKKRTFLSPESFQHCPNRPSICSSNMESIIENFSISQEKQKYIENYIMNKDQQFEIIQQNSIFDAFRNFIDERKTKKLKLSYNLNEKEKESSHSKIFEVKNQQLSDEGSEDCEFLNPKESITSYDKLKETHKQFQRSIKKTHSMLPQMNRIKAEKQNLKQAHFLNMIIEFTVKKSLIKKKLDQSNFQACKEKSQFNSITQKLDPFMLDVQCLINQALKKKKKPHSINIKAANKFLIMTYSRSIDKISRNNAILQNLIRPLFQSFEVIYGALKPNDIYRKMLAFISDILSAKDNKQFNEFIFFLGMDKNNVNSASLTTFDVCLYLKLLEKLNLGGKISSDIQTVFTSKSKVTNELYNVLESQNISPQAIIIVTGKIKVLLQKLEDFVRESLPSTNEESKINLFKVSKMIVEEIIKIRVQSMNKLEMYMIGSQKVIQTTIKDVQRTKNDHINVNSIKEVVECCSISTSKKLYFSKYIEELSAKDNNASGKKMIKKSELGVLLIRIGLVNFDELQERIKYIEGMGKNTIKDHKNHNQQNNNDINYGNFSLHLQKLGIVEIETNNILESMMGDMMIAYEIGLIKNLQSKKDKSKSN